MYNNYIIYFFVEQNHFISLLFNCMIVINRYTSLDNLKNVHSYIEYTYKMYTWTIIYYFFDIVLQIIKKNPITLDNYALFIFSLAHM